MSKRNIAYVKPQDPKFLAQLKQQIGYIDGPSVETKKQKLEDFDSNSDTEDRPEREDEKPQIVVVKTGDLTAEEVAAEEKRLAKEAAEAPADLTRRIVFRKRHKPTESALDIVKASPKTTESEKQNKDKSSKSSKKIINKHTVKLSFNADDEEEEDN